MRGFKSGSHPCETIGTMLVQFYREISIEVKADRDIHFGRDRPGTASGRHEAPVSHRLQRRLVQNPRSGGVHETHAFRPPFLAHQYPHRGGPLQPQPAGCRGVQRLWVVQIRRVEAWACARLFAGGERCRLACAGRYLDMLCDGVAERGNSCGRPLPGDGREGRQSRCHRFRRRSHLL